MPFFPATYWRCWIRSCPSTLQTNLFDVSAIAPNIVIRHLPGEHNHSDDSDMICHEMFRNQVKQHLDQDPSRPIKRSYNAVANDAVRNRTFNRFEIPEFQQIRSSLTRKKHANVPRIPRNIADVRINGPWKKSWSGERFLLHHDRNWGVFVFATDESLQVLQECDYIFVDGTFKSCPRPFYQYVTVHGRFGNRVVNLASCLLVGKTIGHYRQAFQALKRGVIRVTQQQLSPRFVVCDFELAIITAVETEFQTSRVCGCIFHFTKSLYRKIQDIGLARPYRRDVQLRCVLQKCMSMCYLPVALVRQNFLQLAVSPTVTALIHHWPQLQDFMTYVKATYFDGNFPPALWNCYGREQFARTNNFAESKFFNM